MLNSPVVKLFEAQYPQVCAGQVHVSMHIRRFTVSYELHLKNSDIFFCQGMCALDGLELGKYFMFSVVATCDQVKESRNYRKRPIFDWRFLRRKWPYFEPQLCSVGGWTLEGRVSVKYDKHEYLASFLSTL